MQLSYSQLITIAHVILFFTNKLKQLLLIDKCYDHSLFNIIANNHSLIELNSCGYHTWKRISRKIVRPTCNLSNKKISVRKKVFLIYFIIIIIIISVLLTSAPGALFKHSKLGNYFFKKSNSSISNALNTQIFIKSYDLRPLKSTLEVLINISLIIKVMLTNGS